MAITTQKSFFSDASLTSHSHSVTIRQNAKLIVFVSAEALTSISTPTFNGTSMTLVYSQSLNNVILSCHYIDTSLSAGSYTLAYTTGSVGGTNCTVYDLLGAASGVPEASNFETQNNTSAIVGDSFTLTCSAGAYLMAGCINSSTSSTVTVSGDVTAGDDNTANGGHRFTNAAGAQATSGSKSAVFTYSTAATDKVMIAVSVAEAPSGGLSITSVDTDNAVLASQSQATFAGSGLASTAKFAVKRGSAIAYATDISLSGSTGGSFTAPTMTAMFSAGVRFGDVAFFAAETSGTAIASISGSITTATNWKYVNVTDLSATGSMGSLFYGNAVSLSDQVAYSSVTTRFRWPVTVSGDGYFTVNSSGSQAGDEFAYRIWDETDSTWGTEGTIEVNGGISSAEQVYAAGSLVQVSLESSTLEGATLQ